jgi:hypothetical protein
MQFHEWKAALISEIESAAEWRAEKLLADVDDSRITESQAALFELAEWIRSLPANHVQLAGLFSEEGELANLMRATAGEPESRYREAKEELLNAYGIEHPPFATAEQFLEVLRNQVDETISEYRLRV